MDKIYEQNHLEARTGEAAELGTRDMVQFMWQEMEYQLDICKVINDTHVETNYVQNYLRYTLK